MKIQDRIQKFSSHLNDQIFLLSHKPCLLLWAFGWWVHTQRGASQFSSVVWCEGHEHAPTLTSSTLSEEQMLSVLRLTDFLPSDQQFHISLPYGATGHAGKKIRSTFKSSLVPFHLRKASLWCRGAEMHYLSRSCCLTVSPRGQSSKNVTGRFAHNDEVLMQFIWICEAVEEFDNCDCLPPRPLMNFHTSDSLICLLFSDSIAPFSHHPLRALRYPFFISRPLLLTLALTERSRMDLLKCQLNLWEAE